MVNLLPLDEDERITTVMSLPENQEEWENLYVLQHPLEVLEGIH